MRQKGCLPDPDPPPPIVPHRESLAQGAYTEALFPGSGSGPNCRSQWVPESPARGPRLLPCVCVCVSMFYALDTGRGIVEDICYER